MTKIYVKKLYNRVEVFHRPYLLYIYLNRVEDERSLGSQLGKGIL